MGLFKKIAAAFSSPRQMGDEVHMVYVRSHRCREYLSTRISLERDLSAKDEGGYITRKVLVGEGRKRCFERVEVVLHFDGQKKLIDQEITGGDFITAEEYRAEAED